MYVIQATGRFGRNQIRSTQNQPCETAITAGKREADEKGLTMRLRVVVKSKKGSFAFFRFFFRPAFFNRLFFFLFSFFRND